MLHGRRQSHHRDMGFGSPGEILRLRETCPAVHPPAVGYGAVGSLTLKSLIQLWGTVWIDFLIEARTLTCKRG